MDKDDAKIKLKEKLKEQKLSRLSRYSREMNVIKLEEKLKNTKDKREKQRLRKELNVYDKIDEKEAEATTASEYPSYDD